MPSDSSTLEAAYMSGKGQCTLGQYVVDLKKFVQRRKNGGLGEERTSFCVCLVQPFLLLLKVGHTFTWPLWLSH